MDIEENIKIVKEFNEKHRFRDCGRLNNAIDNILEEIEENKKYTIHLTDEQYRKVIENAQKDIEDKYKKQIEELKKYNKNVSDRIVEYKKNSIPKQKVKEIFNRLHINDIEPWSSYKVSGDILFDLEKLFNSK